MNTQRGVHRGLLTYETILALPGRLSLVVLNGIGAIVYMARASNAWANPQERAAGVYSVTGEPFVWFAEIWPIVVVFLALNLSWEALILARRHWVSGRLWLLTVMIWLIAVLVDNAHH
jgi:hypothetical protein